MSELRAFHSDPAIQEKYLKRVQKHAELDEIVKGIYWENGKGCAIGCAIHSGDHSVYESELGIPETIAYLEDRIFEGLPNGDAKQFPLQFLEAIKPGADLSLVTAQFMVWLLSDPEQGVIRFANTDTSGEQSYQIREAIQGVAALYQRVLQGETPTDEEWQSAARAAYAAARAAYAAAYAAYAAARAAAYAASAAYAAARAAAYAASAAYAAASAARAAAYQAMRDKLLELLSVAPVREAELAC